MVVIKINPPYKHLVQKKNLCGSACIQMILFRHGVWIEQEELAYKLGTKINGKDADLYLMPFRKASDGSSKIGMKLKDFNKPKIKNALKKYRFNIGIHRISTVKSPEKFFIKNLKENNDVIINFWWKPINGVDFGHYVLLSEFNTVTKKIKVCDPGQNKRSFWEVRLDKLVKGMNKKFDGNERGFLVVKSNSDT